jgi:uncharacterized RDD family membrane protein YckC
MSSNGLYGGDMTDFVKGAGRAGTSRTGIVTPEAVLLDVETAGFASRATAGAIDLTLQLIAIFLLLLIGVFAFGEGSTFNTFAAFVVFGLLFGYPIGFETLLRGRTPGKAALRLRATCARRPCGQWVASLTGCFLRVASPGCFSCLGRHATNESGILWPAPS